MSIRTRAVRSVFRLSRTPWKTVCCFAANVPLRRGGQQGTQSAADDFMVIDDEDVSGNIHSE